MRFFAILLLFLSWSVPLSSQIISVEIGVNGLTCSQCTRSVEMSIRKLDFVKDVQMNLDNTNGILTFYKDKTISIEQIAQAVFDAGFSVRFLKASINFSGAKISNNDCYELDNNFYQFIEVPDKTLEGSTTVSFIGKKFQPLSEARKWKNKMKKSCSSKNHYFITL